MNLHFEELLDLQDGWCGALSILPCMIEDEDMTPLSDRTRGVRLSDVKYHNVFPLESKEIVLKKISNEIVMYPTSKDFVWAASAMRVNCHILFGSTEKVFAIVGYGQVFEVSHGKLTVQMPEPIMRLAPSYSFEILT